MRISARATLGVASFASLLAATCSGSTESPIGVSSVTPDLAYNDHKVDLVIQGGPFRPAYDIDTGDGRAATQLGAFTAYLSPRGIGPRVAVDSLRWLGPSALAAVLRAGVPSGMYDVEVVDPRGAIAELPMGFESLGQDKTLPTVTILGPEGGTIVNPSAEVPVAYVADDAPGTLGAMQWTVSSPGIVAPLTGSCPLDPGLTHALCQFVFVVPPTLQSAQPLNLNITVTDVAGNEGHAVTTLVAGLAPVVTGFTPEQGPAEGKTEISVVGRNFIPGTQVLVGGVPINPGGGTVVDDKHILGTTPAHDPGAVPLVVRTGGISVEAENPFHFVGKPLVLAVSPSSGPPPGGTPVVVVGKEFREETVILFGAEFGTAVPMQCPTLVSPNRIQGFVPPGLGAVSIWAFDPVSGTDERSLAFTYLAEDSPDGSSVAAPACPGADGGTP